MLKKQLRGVQKQKPNGDGNDEEDSLEQISGKQSTYRYQPVIQGDNEDEGQYGVEVSQENNNSSINPTTNQSENIQIEGIKEAPGYRNISRNSSRPDRPGMSPHPSSRGPINEMLHALQRPVNFQLQKHFQQPSALNQDIQQQQIPKQPFKQSPKTNMFSTENTTRPGTHNQNNNFNNSVIVESKMRVTVTSQSSNSSTASSISPIQYSRIEQNIEHGVKSIAVQNIKEAILHLRSAESQIDSCLQSNEKVPSELILATIINLGICFYRMNLFDEAYSCFSSADSRLKRSFFKNASSQNSNHNSRNNSKKKNNPQNNNTEQQLILQGQQQQQLSNQTSNEANNEIKLNKRINSLTSNCLNEHSAFLSRSIASNDETYLHSLGNKLKRKELRLQLNLQMCIMFSESGKHDIALQQAFKASKICISMVIESLWYCKQTNSSEAAKVFELLSSSFDVLPGNNSLEAYAKSKKYQFQDTKFAKGKSFIETSESIEGSRETPLKETSGNDEGKSWDNENNGSENIPLDMEFITKSVKSGHWLLKCNILSLLHIQSVQLSNLTSNILSKQLIQPEAILRLIVNTTLSFYCISTETRFILHSSKSNKIKNASFKEEQQLTMKGGRNILSSQFQQEQKQQKNHTISDAEFWLGKSLEIAYAMIPHDALMLAQIINIYSRFHALHSQAIPEDGEFCDQMKFLRAQKGVNSTASSAAAQRNASFIPVIRTIMPPRKNQNEFSDKNNTSSEVQFYSLTGSKEQGVTTTLSEQSNAAWQNTQQGQYKETSYGTESEEDEINKQGKQNTSGYQNIIINQKKSPSSEINSNKKKDDKFEESRRKEHEIITKNDQNNKLEQEQVKSPQDKIISMDVEVAQRKIASYLTDTYQLVDKREDTYHDDKLHEQQHNEEGQENITAMEDDKSNKEGDNIILKENENDQQERTHKKVIVVLSSMPKRRSSLGKAKSKDINNTAISQNESMGDGSTGNESQQQDEKQRGRKHEKNWWDFQENGANNNPSLAEISMEGVNRLDQWQLMNQRPGSRSSKDTENKIIQGQRSSSAQSSEKQPENNRFRYNLVNSNNQKNSSINSGSVDRPMSQNTQQQNNKYMHGPFLQLKVDTNNLNSSQPQRGNIFKDSPIQVNSNLINQGKQLAFIQQEGTNRLFNVKRRITTSQNTTDDEQSRRKREELRLMSQTKRREDYQQQQQQIQLIGKRRDQGIQQQSMSFYPSMAETNYQQSQLSSAINQLNNNTAALKVGRTINRPLLADKNNPIKKSFEFTSFPSRKSSYSPGNNNIVFEHVIINNFLASTPQTPTASNSLIGTPQQSKTFKGQQQQQQYQLKQRRNSAVSSNIQFNTEFMNTGVYSNNNIVQQQQQQQSLIGQQPQHLRLLQGNNISLPFNQASRRIQTDINQDNNNNPNQVLQQQQLQQKIARLRTSPDQKQQQGTFYTKQSFKQ